MFKIYVDGDSCPVKDEIVKVAGRYDLDIYFVSNSWARDMVGDKIHRILVSKDFDACDDWIEKHIDENDIAITADILLAERCLKKNASVINPNGKVFTHDNIGYAVSMRAFSAHLRETGEMPGYNPSFSKQDRSNFLQEFDKIIQKLK